MDPWRRPLGHVVIPPPSSSGERRHPLIFRRRLRSLAAGARGRATTTLISPSLDPPGIAPPAWRPPRRRCSSASRDHRSGPASAIRIVTCIRAADAQRRRVVVSRSSRPGRAGHRPRRDRVPPGGRRSSSPGIENGEVIGDDRVGGMDAHRPRERTARDGRGDWLARQGRQGRRWSSPLFRRGLGVPQETLDVVEQPIKSRLVLVLGYLRVLERQGRRAKQLAGGCPQLLGQTPILPR